MKKFLIALAALFIVSASAQAQSLSDLLGALKSTTTSSSSSSSSSSSTQSTASGLSSLLGTLGQTIQNATASSSFSLDDLVGTWKYSSPAVAFSSDDILKSIGGAAASTQIENKLAPYYKKMGMNNVVLTVDSSYNFTMKMKVGSLSGTISKNDDGTLAFNFSAFGAYTLGSINSIATKSGNQLNLTFDAERLMTLMQTVSKLTSNSTISTVTSLLQSYDGIYIGYKLKKS
jgi:hypothetical protein